MGWLDALGWAGSALLVFSLMQARVLRFRALNLVACVVLVVFNAAIEVWPMVAMNAVLCAINAYYLVKLMRDRHDQRAFSVIEVGPQDEYLTYILRRYGEEILAFQPDFVWDGAAPGRRAYLVLHGDETVGVVLIHDDGDGTAHVLLDFVTKRYRDFTPGEFVWRRSTLLKDSGFRRVVTPAGMVAPYYDRLGFRAAGPSYVLEL
jgi:hypothetical protein